MGMFESRHALQAGIWGIPMTVLLSYVPVIGVQIKAAIWGGLVGFPCLVILSGYFDRMLYRIRFQRNAKTYYTEREGRRQ